MTHFLWSLVRALASVAGRRLRFGPKRPSWSFGFEVLVSALRLHTRWLTRLPIPALRKATEQLKGRIADGVTLREERVGSIPVTWFTPQDHANRVLLYLHGGGHIFGSAAQDCTMASQLARLTKSRVVAPDFRLAPEAPYPADVEDVITVYECLRPTNDDLVLAGLSSGAGLALAVLVHLRDAGKPLPRRAVLLSPMVDATGTSASWSSNASVDWAPPEAVLRWAKMYAGMYDSSEPGISPVNAKLEGLPPLLVVAGDAELLRDDAVRLAERGRAAGVDVTLHVEPDMVHAFMAFGRNDPPTRRFLDIILRFLRK